MEDIFSLQKPTIMKNIIFLFVSIIISVSCEFRSNEKILPGSIGRYNELMVVMNHKDWEGKIGQELKKVIQSDVLGLPQPEPQFAITQIPNKGFQGFLKHNRNIVRITKADKPTFELKHDVYAKQQTFLDLKGPDKQSIVQLIKDNAAEIIASFKESDLKQMQKDLGKKAHKPKNIKTFSKQGFSMKVPLKYSKIDDTGDFVWFRADIRDFNHHVDGSMNIIGYALPLNMPFENIKDSITSIRNRIGKKYVPGAREGSYLTTEAAYDPHYYTINIDEKKALKINGKWEVLHEFMAGPFINYTIEDPKKKRIIVVEAFTFAPSAKKRDLMFEQEAVLQSVHIE